jgi:hypothetical protein
MVATAYFGRWRVLVRNGPQQGFNADVRTLSLLAVQSGLSRSVERTHACLFTNKCPNLITTQVTLHQNGRDIVAKRMDDADIKRADDEAAVINASKTRSSRPEPKAPYVATSRGCSAEPDYEMMSPQLAGITRQQLPQLKATMAQWGRLQSVTFTGVGPAGADICQVKFEHGTNGASCSAPTAKPSSSAASRSIEPERRPIELGVKAFLIAPVQI